MIATGVPSDHIDYAWTTLWPFLDRAMRYSDEKMASDDIAACIRRNACQAWLVYDKNIPAAGICTKFLRERTSGHLECLIWLIGGERLSSWAPDFLSKLIPWAKAEGATVLVAGGRKGWARWAERYGFERLADREGLPYWGRAI